MNFSMGKRNWILYLLNPIVAYSSWLWLELMKLASSDISHHGYFQKVFMSISVSFAFTFILFYLCACFFPTISL